jgi:predicted nucleic acid-binding protein
VTRWAIVDTGPLVAYLDRREAAHERVVEAFRQLASPALVCEPVLTEAAHLLRHLPDAQDALLGLVAAGALHIAFNLESEIDAVRALRRKYRDLPMSLADGCIVRMAELHDQHVVFTLDSDFHVYRKNGREPLPLLGLKEP